MKQVLGSLRLEGEGRVGVLGAGAGVDARLRRAAPAPDPSPAGGGELWPRGAIGPTPSGNEWLAGGANGTQ